jgi:hypothetical protein
MPSNHFLPLVGNDSIGQRTLYGTWLPPGARVAAYVGPQSDSTDSYVNSSLLVSTLNAGLARCRSGKGDVVVLLPGYTENVSTADFYTSLVAGTRIVGIGNPGETIHPTLTWTATASTFLLDVADVHIDNITMNWAGIDNVVAPITVSAAGCSITNCKITVQSATASAGAAGGLVVAVGASGFTFSNNVCLSDDEDEPLTGAAIVEISGAAPNVTVDSNYMSFAAAATVGGIRISAAAPNFKVRRNQMVNLETTSGDVNILISSATAMGVVADNDLKYMTGADPNAADKGLSLNSATLVGNFRNYSVDDADLGAILTEPHAGS